MSPLVWDLAHIAAYEDLWLCHRHGGLELLHPELAAMYDAFETPRAVRGDLPLLDRPQAEEYLAEVRARSLEVLEPVDVPAGPFRLGAASGGFAYDNERPRHQTDVRRFRIGQVPITNATYR